MAMFLLTIWIVGPLIMGHAHPDVVEALRETALKETSFGAPTLLETEMAKLVDEACSFHRYRSNGEFRYGSDDECLRLARGVNRTQ